MPHYADGTEARPGDLVRGLGYNIKDPETGELAWIEGVVLHVDPSSQACNIQVFVPNYPPSDSEPVGLGMLYRSPEPPSHILRGQLEYGQCDHFTKL